jgi:hypothetical protein
LFPALLWLLCQLEEMGEEVGLLLMGKSKIGDMGAKKNNENNVDDEG